MEKFCFFMGPDCCSLLAGKKCATESGKKADDVYYCYDLARSIEDNGWDSNQECYEPYAMVLHPCGRYTISSGQHRFCIIQRKNIAIPAVYKKQKSECYKHRDICEKLLNKIDKNLYLSDSMECIVDENGVEVYSEQRQSVVSRMRSIWKYI